MKSSDQNLTKLKDFNYPFSTSSRDNDGLTLKINRNKEIQKEELCFDNSFIVHGNDEYPLKFQFTDVCEYEFGTSMEVIITPVVINTEENLRRFSPERRHCYFDDERELRFYKKYSKYKCEMECLSNYTLESCHCVPFDIIRDKYTTVCGINSIICTRNADYEVKFEPNSKIVAKCNCLPECTSIKYNVEYIITKLSPNFDT